MRKIKNPFRLEEYRVELVRDKKYKKLLKTYKPSFPEIKDENTPKFWDKLNKRDFINAKDEPMAYHRLIIVSSLIGDTAKVLNIGAGAGDLENYVFNKQKKNKLEWYGVDIAPKSILKLNRQFPYAHFYQGDVRKQKFDKNFFNYVIVMEVMEHIQPSNTFKVLKEINRVLKQNGKLIVSVPLNEGLEEMVRRGDNPNAHLRVYTPELIEAELDIAGFRVVWKKLLFAFPNFYYLKTLIARICTGIRNPNNLILLAEKK